MPKAKPLFARTSPTSTMCVCLTWLASGRQNCLPASLSVSLLFSPCRKACHCNLDHIHRTSRCSSPACFLCVPSQYFTCSYAQFPTIKSPKFPKYIVEEFFFIELPLKWDSSVCKIRCHFACKKRSPNAIMGWGKRWKWSQLAFKTTMNTSSAVVCDLMWDTREQKIPGVYSSGELWDQSDPSGSPVSLVTTD